MLEMVRYYAGHCKNRYRDEAGRESSLNCLTGIAAIFSCDIVV